MGVSDGGRTCADCGGGMNNIVAVIDHHVEHGCSPVLRAEDLTSSERGTLLYVESQVVDNRGRLDHERMNFEDDQNLKLLQAAGLLTVADDTDRYDADGMHAIVEEFTDDAWDLARDCRQMRAAAWIDRDVDLGDVPGQEAEDGEVVA